MDMQLTTPACVCLSVVSVIYVDRFSVLDPAENGTGSGSDPVNDGVNIGGVSPELDMLPMGATRNTWPNIVRNKKNVIFCSTQFTYIDNRERCINDFVKGPLLD